MFPTPPDEWRKVADQLYDSNDLPIRQLAENIGATFGDTSRADEWRATLKDANRSKAERDHAFSMLSKTASIDERSGKVFIDLLDDSDFRSKAIRSLRAFDDTSIADALIERHRGSSAEDQALLIDTLISRKSYANVLLDSIAAGKLSSDLISAHHARQIVNLGDTGLVTKVEDVWGKINATPEAVSAEIAAVEKLFVEAPLWAFSAQAGHGHFQRLCVSCHQANDKGGLIGPDLTGSGSNGARYFLENIIDPNAVVGADFQITLVTTKDGQTIAGMITEDTASALTLRTVTDPVVVRRRASKAGKLFRSHSCHPLCCRR